MGRTKQYCGKHIEESQEDILRATRPHVRYDRHASDGRPLRGTLTNTIGNATCANNWDNQWNSLGATPPPTVHEPVATKVSSLGDTPPPTRTTQLPSPKPHPAHPAHTPNPENILDILEEEWDDNYA